MPNAKTQTLKLTPVDPDNERDIAELTRQRALCGWGEDKVPTWQKMMRSGDRCLYWIHPTDSSLYPLPAEEPFSLMPGHGPPPPDPSFQPLGHIALDREDYYVPPNKLLADKATGVMTLATFFILKSQQGRGLGGAAMDLIEAEARELGAPEITLTTIPAKNATNPDYWARIGAPYDPKARVNEVWYKSRGYVTFQEDIPLYSMVDKDGNHVILDSVSMRKVLV